MKTDLTSDYKVTTSDDFPRLRLEQNERALIVCIEPTPEMEFVHTLRVPQLDESGHVIKIEKPSNKPGGKSYFETQRDFVGQHRCFGLVENLLKAGVGYDPEHCPTCAAVDDTEGAFEKPERRYAMHVLQYSLQGGGMNANSGWTPAQPLTMKTVVWTFGQGRMNDLIDLKETWEDLRAHDLRLGPCTVKNFQKYDMNMIPTAAWTVSQESKQYAVDVYRNNRCADLSALIGRKITREQASEDISTVLSVYARMNGAVDQGGPSMQSNSADLSATVSDILDSVPATPAAAPAAAVATVDLDSMFDKDAVVPPPAEPAVAEPETAAVEPVAASASVPDDLSELVAAAPASAGDDPIDLNSFLADLN